MYYEIETERYRSQIDIENLRFEMFFCKKKAYNYVDVADVAHIHHYNEIFVCVEDSVCIRLDDDCIMLNKNDVAVIPPTVEHCLDKVEDVYAKTLVVGFSFAKKKTKCNYDFFNLFQSAFYKKGAIVLRNKQDLCRSFMELVESIKKNDRFCPAQVLLGVLTDIAGEKTNIQGIKDFVPISIGIDRIDALEHIIGARYYTDITAEDAAKELYISERQLSRIVNKRYGTSFRKEITNQRIKAAEMYLGSSKLSIAEICSKIGFKNINTFYREFKLKNGISPTQYRKNYSNKKEQGF